MTRLFLSNKEKAGASARFVKFALARLSTFCWTWGSIHFCHNISNIIGQFVHNDIKAVNTIETLFAQIVIIVLNYVFSKVFVFKNKSTNKRQTYLKWWFVCNLKEL